MGELYNPLIPAAFGNEYEASELLVCMVNDASEGEKRRVVIPSERVDLHMLPELEGYMGFLLNGSRLYNGRNSNDAQFAGMATGPSSISGRVEIATAEAVDIETAVALTQVTDRMMLKGSARTASLLQAGKVPSLTGTWINKRASDGKGNSWGHHDNFGYEPDSRLKIVDSNRRRGSVPFLVSFLNARSLFTGAGQVLNNGTYVFAQKLQHVEDISISGYKARHFRFEADLSERYQRLEISSIDPNISDWATLMRLGSVALFIADILHGEKHEFKKFLPQDNRKDGLLEDGKLVNIVGLRPESGIHLTRRQIRCVKMVMRVAEVYLERVHQDVGDPVYEYIAKELLRFGADLMSVHAGEAQYTLLDDRADWAAKAELVERRIEVDRGNGIDRRFGDAQSQKDDIAYDYCGMKLQEDGTWQEVFGSGFRLRQNGRFIYRTDEKLVDTYYEAPPAGRSTARVNVLKTDRPVNCTVNVVDWNMVRELEEYPGFQKYYKFNLDDVRDGTVPERVPHVYPGPSQPAQNS